MKTFKVSVAGALAFATFFVSSSSILAATTVSCPAPALYLDMSRGNSTDANTGGQVSSLQAFLWQYKSIYPSWSFPVLKENFVVGIYGRRTETVVKDFQKTFMPSVVWTSGYGMVGPMTRAEILNQCASNSVTNAVTVTSPTAGETIAAGSIYTIRWSTTPGIPSTATSTITFVSLTNPTVTAAVNVLNDGVETITVPPTLQYGGWSVRVTFFLKGSGTYGVFGTSAAFNVTNIADSAAYSFNSTVLVDATGHGVPATNYGAALTSAGKFNAAFSFDGVDDYVKVDLLNNPTAYTLEAWVKPADTTNRNIIVRTNSSGPASVWSHEIAISNGKFIHYTFDAAAKVIKGTTSIVPGAWYHVAAVAQNNGQARLYINGVEEGTPASVGTLWAGGDRYLVGSNASFASLFTSALANFKGTIDEVRIYHRALTRDEIINDMNSSTQIAQAQPLKSTVAQSATRSSLASILQAISALTAQLQLYIKGF